MTCSGREGARSFRVSPGILLGIARVFKGTTGETADSCEDRQCMMLLATMNPRLPSRILFEHPSYASKIH